MTKKRSVAGELILFSLPLIASGILQQLYSWADAFIVGHAEGELPLAAVGATFMISSLLINIVVGFTFGLSILGSQECGRGNRAGIRSIFTNFLPILAAAYLVVAGVAIAFSDTILRWMGTPAEIFGYSYEYLSIVLIGAPFIAVYNLYAAMLRSLGNTKASFYAVLISSLMNVGLDVLFVVVLSFGVGGAALATVLSQIGMTAFMAIYGSVKYPELRPEGSVFEGKVIREGMKFGIPPMLQNSITSFGSLVLQNFMNGFGAVTVLAITTAYRVDSIMLLPILNLGAAISNMVARSEGAKDKARIRSYFKTGSLMMVIVCAALTASMYLFGEELVAMFGVTGEALRQGGVFFKDLAMFYLLFGLATSFRGVLEGVGDITCCSIIGIGCLGMRIGASYIMKPFFGTRTIAFAEGAAWIVMLAAFTVRLVIKRKKLTISE